MPSSRVVVTVLGQDRVGIVAGISAVLAENQVNIIDISQSIMGDLFTMIMLVDMAKSTLGLLELKEKLEAKGAELGVQIMVQREEVFRAMHRV